MSDRIHRAAVSPSLAAATAVTVVAAIALDILAAEHPTHTLALSLVALAVGALRLRLAGRRDEVFAAVSGALIAQPALRAVTEATVGHTTSYGGLLHVAANDGAITAVQIVVPTIIVAFVALCERLFRVLIRTIWYPLCQLVRLSAEAPVAAGQPAPEFSTRSLLRACGWALQAARRGPPTRTGHSPAYR